MKKIQWQNVTPSGNRTWASHNLWFQVQHSTFYTNLTFAYKNETLGSLYSHALLILLKSSKSKYQVSHEQKFKNLLSSTCQVSVERRVLDLESEDMRCPGSIPTGGNILSLDFFSCSKASDANIGIIANFVNLRKTRLMSMESLWCKSPSISHKQSLYPRYGYDLFKFIYKYSHFVFYIMDWISR